MIRVGCAGRARCTCSRPRCLPASLPPACPIFDGPARLRPFQRSRRQHSTGPTGLATGLFAFFSQGKGSPFGMHRSGRLPGAGHEAEAVDRQHRQIIQPYVLDQVERSRFQRLANPRQGQVRVRSDACPRDPPARPRRWPGGPDGPVRPAARRPRTAGTGPAVGAGPGSHPSPAASRTSSGGGGSAERRACRPSRRSAGQSPRNCRVRCQVPGVVQLRVAPAAEASRRRDRAARRGSPQGTATKARIRPSTTSGLPSRQIFHQVSPWPHGDASSPSSSTRRSASRAAATVTSRLRARSPANR
jgi:hypothetical protein